MYLFLDSPILRDNGTRCYCAGLIRISRYASARVRAATQETQLFPLLKLKCRTIAVMSLARDGRGVMP